MYECRSCGKHFRSVGAFDMHRTGRHGKDRRCLTSEEMLKAGMIERIGYWIGSEMPIAAVAGREIFNVNEAPGTQVAGQAKTREFEATE